MKHVYESPHLQSVRVVMLPDDGERAHAVCSLPPASRNQVSLLSCQRHWVGPTESARVCSSLRPRAASSLPQVYELPFLVALDHRKEAVVVAVRGTMSLQVRGPTWVAGDRGPQPASCRCLPACLLSLLCRN